MVVRCSKKQEKEGSAASGAVNQFQNIQHHHVFWRMNNTMISSAVKQFHNIHSPRFSLFRLSKPKSPIILPSCFSTNNNVSSPISICFNSQFPCNFHCYSLFAPIYVSLFKHNNSFHHPTYCFIPPFFCFCRPDLQHS